MKTIQIKITTEQEGDITTVLEQVKQHLTLGHTKGSGSSGTESYNFSVTEKAASKTRIRRKKVLQSGEKQEEEVRDYTTTGPR